jgi:hypothetical protein
MSEKRYAKWEVLMMPVKMVSEERRRRMEKREILILSVTWHYIWF